MNIFVDQMSVDEFDRTVLCQADAEYCSGYGQNDFYNICNHFFLNFFTLGEKKAK